MEAQLVWNKIINEYKKNITEQTFSAFFKNLEPIALKNNTIYFLSENVFLNELIEKNHKDNIEKISRDLSIPHKIVIARDMDELEEAAVLQNEEDDNPTLIKKHTFSNFVIGNSNKFAHAASVAVADAPAQSYNPLFLYGGVGLGKTHLMHAIGNHVVSQNKNAKILYLTSEEFTNDLINSIKDDKNEDFRNKYRKVDVLLIDDIQFIAGKERTQEEFFHTFNALHSSNKQIIISSDKPPKEIPTLEDRLRTRFEMGLIADIQSPDYETRIAILRKKAQADNKEVSNEVMEYIAKNIKSNIRELEGALIRVFAYAKLVNEDVNYDLACEALKDLFKFNTIIIITPQLIKEKVSQKYNIKIEDFDSKKRTKEIAFPRQVAMYLCRELTDMSLPKIGENFGKRDHTTVMHAHDKISTDMESDPQLKILINSIIEDIRS
ncbi:MAG: chromosomal replication initiator protein DnaA [Filifactoraceae bacterium]